MAHINDLYEQQAKDLLHRLCDALGIEQEDRTKAKVEAEIREIKEVRQQILETSLESTIGDAVRDLMD